MLLWQQIQIQISEIQIHSENRQVTIQRTEVVCALVATNTNTKQRNANTNTNTTKYNVEKQRREVVCALVATCRSFLGSAQSSRSQRLLVRRQISTHLTLQRLTETQRLTFKDTNIKVIVVAFKKIDKTSKNGYTKRSANTRTTTG